LVSLRLFDKDAVGFVVAKRQGEIAQAKGNRIPERRSTDNLDFCPWDKPHIPESAAHLSTGRNREDTGLFIDPKIS
jgi:hypothetical protein